LTFGVLGKVEKKARDQAQFRALSAKNGRLKGEGLNNELSRVLKRKRR